MDPSSLPRTLSPSLTDYSLPQCTISCAYHTIPLVIAPLVHLLIIFILTDHGIDELVMLELNNYLSYIKARKVVCEQSSFLATV